MELFNILNNSRDKRIYHPHRADSADRNLTRINENDYLAGARCTCESCLAFPDSIAWAYNWKVIRGGKNG